MPTLPGGSALVGVLSMSPATYSVVLIVDLVAGVVVYRSSERFAARWGRTPGRIPSALWGVLVVLFGIVIGGLSFWVARVVTQRRLAGYVEPGVLPTSQPPSGTAAPVAGWYPDPASRHELRYWDGRGWSEHVMDGGVRGTDPT